MSLTLRNIDEYTVWHKFIIVNTDPTIGGDLLCVELMPKTIWQFQLIITISWGLLLTALAVNSYVFRKKVGTRYSSI